MRSARGFTLSPGGDGTAARGGFTTIELLVVVAIIGVLASLLIPAISMIKRKAKITVSQNRVVAIEIAMRTYADEDPRRFFPPTEVGNRMTYDAREVTLGVLNLLETSGYQVSVGELGGNAGSPRPLVDGFLRPLRYALDGPFLTSGGAIDASLMNGNADRPAPRTDWNPDGSEPHAYIWSLGEQQVDEATDALPTNAANWIYTTGSP